jgi:hypothetical protein
MLKTGYNRDTMNQAAIASVSGPYEPATAFVKFVVDHFYDPDRWPPDRREQVLIAILTVHCRGEGLLVAAHLYWGLMEGLPVHVIADTLLLTSAYTGIPNFTSGIGTLKSTLNVLKRLADAPDAATAVNCLNVMKQLTAAFTLPGGPVFTG